MGLKTRLGQDGKSKLIVVLFEVMGVRIGALERSKAFGSVETWDNEVHDSSLHDPAYV